MLNTFPHCNVLWTCSVGGFTWWVMTAIIIYIHNQFDFLESGKSAVDSFVVNGRVGKHLSIMQLTRPANVHIHKWSTVINHGLHDDSVVSLVTIVIRCALLRITIVVCELSAPPAACGNPQHISNPSTTSFSFSLWNTRAAGVYCMACFYN